MGIVQVFPIIWCKKGILAIPSYLYFAQRQLRIEDNTTLRYSDVLPTN
jgi:hypothetical protein